MFNNVFCPDCDNPGGGGKEGLLSGAIPETGAAASPAHSRHARIARNETAAGSMLSTSQSNIGESPRHVASRQLIRPNQVLLGVVSARLASLLLKLLVCAEGGTLPATSSREQPTA